MSYKKIVIIISLIIIMGGQYAFAQTPEIVFGPEKYERDTGSPNVITDSFSVCDPNGTFTLIIENGMNGENRISSASVWINGDEIVKENEFNQKIAKIEKSVNLLTDNEIKVEVKSKPDSYLTISIEGIMQCFKIEIASPADGEIINKEDIMVTGEVKYSTKEIGVKVNGIPALINGNQFIANNINLAIGENIIQAVAVDTSGNTVEDSIIVKTENIVQPVNLKANLTSGINPLEINFLVDANIQNPVVNYLMDFEGDGITDYESSTFTESLSNVYDQEGLYLAKIIVIDDQDNQYEDTLAISILSKEEVDTLLQEKWDGVKTALIYGDIEEALACFDENSRDKYEEIFTLLSDKLPILAADMQDIEIIYQKGDIAKYRIKRELEINGEFLMVTYYIYFAKDENGFWKIDSF